MNQEEEKEWIYKVKEAPGRETDEQSEQEKYWAEKERVREEAAEKDKFAGLPFPNRKDRRKKARATRLDESPMTKPSIDKRVHDRKKREKSK